MSGAPGRSAGLVLAWVLVAVAGGCDSQTVAFAAPGFVSGAPAAAPRGKAGCIPNCRGKGCGGDGCGGRCGRCAPGRLCLADRCVKSTVPALCKAVAGRWKGVLRARPLHYLDGRIFRQGNRCAARFRVSYNLPRRGRAWVVQELDVTFTGVSMRMRGVRISSKSSNSNYNLDRFTGNLDRKLTRFSGHNRDVRGSTSAFSLTRN